MDRTFPRQIDALAEISEFVDQFLASEGLDRSLSFDINLIIEELFTNMIKYNTEGRQDIAVRIDRSGEELILCLTDFDVEPFDITQTPQVDTGAPLEERRIGGLGIHFVRQVSDRIDYEYQDRNSRVTVTKKLSRSDV